MDTKITVVVPVGPAEEYKQWLPECFDSILNQTYKPDEIFIVDDQNHLSISDYFHYYISGIDVINNGIGFEIYQHADIYWNELIDGGDPNTQVRISKFNTPWLMGVAYAFNLGISLARNELVFMHGSDDVMYPTCFEEIVREYKKQQSKDAWYNVTNIIQDGTVADIPNNSAAITKNLWKLLGGFSPAAALAAPDALLLSIMMTRMSDRIIQVKQGTPLVWCRQHDQQATRHDMSFYAASGIVEVIRNKETQRWEKPEWTNKL